MSSNPARTIPHALDTRAHPTPDEVIVFARGTPPLEAFPVEELMNCFTSAVAADPAITLQYGQPAGYEPLRHLLAAQYDTDTHHVLIANGALQLLDLLTAHLTQPGRVVLTEQPSYDRAITTLRRHAVRPI